MGEKHFCRIPSCDVLRTALQGEKKAGGFQWKPPVPTGCPQHIQTLAGRSLWREPHL